MPARQTAQARMRAASSDSCPPQSRDRQPDHARLSQSGHQTGLQAQDLHHPVHLALTKEECATVSHYLALWPHQMQECGTASGAGDRMPAPGPAADLTADTAACNAHNQGRKQCQALLLRHAAATERDDIPGEAQAGVSRTAVVSCQGPYMLEHDPTAACGLRREETLAAALCSLGIAMVAGMCQEQGLLSMHGALLAEPGRTDRGLVLLGDNRCGKSSLAVRLMAEGMTCFGDDMLGLDAHGTFTAFGLAPRLRLPLPASARLQDFASRHAGPGDERAFFLQADADILAPFGAHCQAGAIVFLCREPGRDSDSTLPALVRLSPQEALPLLIHRFFMQENSALQVLEAATVLAEHVPCCMFSYTALDTAADFLAALVRQKLPLPALSGASAGQEQLHLHSAQPVWTGAAPGRMSASPDLDRQPHSQAGGKAGPDCGEHGMTEDGMTEDSMTDDGMGNNAMAKALIDPEQDYVCAAGSQCVLRLGHTFVLPPAHNALHILNETAAVIWTMLADGLCLEEAVLLLSQTFPDTEEEQIRADMTLLFEDLAEAGLIVPAMVQAL